MDKSNNARLVSTDPAGREADLQAAEARSEVLNLDDWQLVLVGGGDNTPNW